MPMRSWPKPQSSWYRGSMNNEAKGKRSGKILQCADNLLPRAFNVHGKRWKIWAMWFLFQNLSRFPSHIRAGICLQQFLYKPQKQEIVWTRGTTLSFHWPP